ncbi:hypothetical protein Q7P36_011132 [Cladosporium allicinum]
MVGSRVLHILKKIPAGSIMVGDREVVTSIAAQTESYKRLDAVMETHKALLHKTLQENLDMIDPKTGEIMMTQVHPLNPVSMGTADPINHITCKLWDKDGNTMPTAHYPVKKTDEKPKADEKSKDEGKK